jgi:single-stranded-DNA-specific exonuclease
MNKNKKNWVYYPKKPEIQDIISRTFNLSLITSQILINRGINTKEEANIFFNSNLSMLHNPFLMKGMENAVNRIEKAIVNKEKIIVYGDFDVDGITATAVVLLFFKAIGADVTYYIPHRIKEGYSLNLKTLENLLKKNPQLFITVDCGISNVKEVDKLKELGIDVIITDHHEIHNRLPNADAILNPLQKDCSFPFKHLSGVGISFNLIMALRNRLRKKGFFKKKSPPNLKNYLDLVTLGTLGDIVPLLDENRIFVKHGLSILTKSNRPGIIALKEVAGLTKEEEVTPYTSLFRLIPRLNATGRLDSASLSLELLITNNYSHALKLARKLDQDNTKRQKLDEKVVKDVRKKLEEDSYLLNQKILVLASSRWHQGVIGIAASKLSEEYCRPTILIALDEEQEIGRGSARSLEGIHIYEILKCCEDLLLYFGGHKYAAGFSIYGHKINEFKEKIKKTAEEKIVMSELEKILYIDGEVDLNEIKPELVEEFERLAPFGPSNPEPTLCSKGIEVIQSRVVGKNHLKLFLKVSYRKLDAIGFNMAEFFPSDLQKIKAAFIPQFNNWQGERNIQLKLRDIKILNV